MTYRIDNGWIHGELPGPGNRMIRVDNWSRGDGKTLQRHPPNLVLHTTEGSSNMGDAYKHWEFPPNFACGDFRIVQLFPLNRASYALKWGDEDTLQIEMAHRIGDHVANWLNLPPDSTLFPTVALVAFLHQRRLISSGIRRPNPNWPVRLDRGPQASTAYYRRNDGTWPSPGVYGHVEIPHNDHYDPGSFNYPVFFQMVDEILRGGEDMGFEQFKSGVQRKQDGMGPPPDTAEPDVKFGYRMENRRMETDNSLNAGLQRETATRAAQDLDLIEIIKTLQDRVKALEDSGGTPIHTHTTPEYAQIIPGAITSPPQGA